MDKPNSKPFKATNHTTFTNFHWSKQALGSNLTSVGPEGTPRLL